MWCFVVSVECGRFLVRRKLFQFVVNHLVFEGNRAAVEALSEESGCAGINCRSGSSFERPSARGACSGALRSLSWSHLFAHHLSAWSLCLLQCRRRWHRSTRARLFVKRFWLEIPWAQSTSCTATIHRCRPNRKFNFEFAIARESSICDPTRDAMTFCAAARHGCLFPSDIATQWRAALPAAEPSGAGRCARRAVA